MSESPEGETLPSVMALERRGLALPELLAGRYRIGEPLGEGGMGTVVRGFDLDLEETVGIKLLRPELADDEGLRARFRREVKLARRVTHVQVARIFEFGRDGPLCFLTMEFIAGESLQSLLEREAPLAPARALELVIELCEGLAAAHAAGVVHGDIKPANVLVAPGRGAVLTDFGIAQALLDADRVEEGVSGTPLYMAPEQARGEAMTPATDVYAVGEVFYEALTGSTLWPIGEVTTLLTHKREDGTREMSALYTNLPSAWTRLIVECLRRDPRQRPADARALLSRLFALRNAGEEARPRRVVAEPLAAGAGLPWILVEPIAAPPELAWIGVGLIDALALVRGLRVVRGGGAAPAAGPRIAARIAGEARPTASGVAVTIRVCAPDDDAVLTTLELEQPGAELHLLGAELAARIADAVHATGGAPAGREAVDADVAELVVAARHAYLTMQSDRAERLFAAARAAAPGDEQLCLWHTLARVQSALIFRDPGPAQLAVLRGEVEVLLERHGELGEPHLALGRILLALGDAAGCARSLVAATRRAPSLVEAHAMLGDLLVTIGRLPDAERRLDIALMLDPGAVRGWLGRARLWAYQGRWDDFYQRAEPALAELRFRTPLLIRLMLWRPDPAVLERYAVVLADNREGLPARIWHAARDLVAFGLGREDRRAIVERIASSFTGSSRISGFFSQIVCELLCAMDEPARALEFLELADRGGLSDWQWIEHCPVLAPLRGEPRFVDVRERVRGRADAVAEAIWG